jgi:hypothetical protein
MSAAAGKVQFNVYLPSHLVVAIKHRAVDEDVSLSGLLERILSEYLDATGDRDSSGTKGRG